MPCSPALGFYMYRTPDGAQLVTEATYLVEPLIMLGRNVAAVVGSHNGNWEGMVMELHWHGSYTGMCGCVMAEGMVVSWRLVGRETEGG